MDLASEMHENGSKSWNDVRTLLWTVGLWKVPDTGCCGGKMTQGSEVPTESSSKGNSGVSMHTRLAVALPTLVFAFMLFVAGYVQSAQLLHSIGKAAIGSAIYGASVAMYLTRAGKKATHPV